VFSAHNTNFTFRVDSLQLSTPRAQVLHYRLDISLHLENALLDVSIRENEYEGVCARNYCLDRLALPDLVSILRRLPCLCPTHELHRFASVLLVKCMLPLKHQPLVSSLDFPTGRLSLEMP
jgi:hypothetical protein